MTEEINNLTIIRDQENLPGTGNFYFHTNPYEAGRLFTLKPDGEIERGPKFTTEHEASLKFWDCIAKSFPAWKQRLLDENKPKGDL